jgi:hypothetical protein
LKYFGNQGNMITALAFVPKGKARAEPLHDEAGAEEMQELKAAALKAAELDALRQDGQDGADDEMSADDSSEDEDADAAVWPSPPVDKFIWLLWTTHLCTCCLASYGTCCHCQTPELFSGILFMRKCVA